MIIHDEFDQGSLAWLQARLGIPTASEFGNIITPAKGELSKSSTPYMYKLIAEKLLNKPLSDIDNLQWVERGKELEPEAVKHYEFLQDIETKAVGFVTTDDGKAGASPDRLWVNGKGGVEIKCPAPQTQIKYLVENFGNAYKAQTQGQMWVCELEFIDRYAYHPDMPAVVDRIYRDDEYIKKLAVAVKDFNDLMAETLEIVKTKGVFIAAPLVGVFENAYKSNINMIHGEQL